MEKTGKEQQQQQQLPESKPKEVTPDQEKLTFDSQTKIQMLKRKCYEGGRSASTTRKRKLGRLLQSEKESSSQQVSDRSKCQKRKDGRFSQKEYQPRKLEFHELGFNKSAQLVKETQRTMNNHNNNSQRAKRCKSMPLFIHQKFSISAMNLIETERSRRPTKCTAERQNHEEQSSLSSPLDEGRPKQQQTVVMNQPDTVDRQPSSKTSLNNNNNNKPKKIIYLETSGSLNTSSSAGRLSLLNRINEKLLGTTTTKLKTNKSDPTDDKNKDSVHQHMPSMKDTTDDVIEEDGRISSIQMEGKTNELKDKDESDSRTETPTTDENKRVKNTKIMESVSRIFANLPQNYQQSLDSTKRKSSESSSSPSSAHLQTQSSHASTSHVLEQNDDGTKENNEILLSSSSASTAGIQSQIDDCGFHRLKNSISGKPTNIDVRVPTQPQSQSEISVLSLPGHDTYFSQIESNNFSYSPSQGNNQRDSRSAMNSASTVRHQNHPPGAEEDLDPITDISFWKSVASTDQRSGDDKRTKYANPSFQQALANIIIAKNQSTNKNADGGLLWLPSILAGNFDLKTIH
jgi:hypothetical protein